MLLTPTITSDRQNIVHFLWLMTANQILYYWVWPTLDNPISIHLDLWVDILYGHPLNSDFSLDAQLKMIV